MVDSLQVLVGFGVDYYILEVEGRVRAGPVEHDLADGLGEEEAELPVILIEELRLNWLL